MQTCAARARSWGIALIVTAYAFASNGCMATAIFKRYPARASVAEPAPASAPAPALPRITPVGDSKSKGYELAETGLTLRGVPYRPGGTTTGGFDCSGFTQYVFRQHGIRLPRSTGDQAHEGKSIKRRDIKAGDLVFFKTVGRETSHVAIAIGGGRFVHAPSSTGVVRVEALDSVYWRPRFVSARRVS